MAHIHLQDGTLPLLWALAWYGIMLLLLGACLARVRSRDTLPTKILAVAALTTATAFAASQVPVFGDVHLTLIPLVGILAGPVVGSLVAFLVNLMSASVGHGGWSVLGANTLVGMAEAGVAGALFLALSGRMPDPFRRGTLSTLVALSAGNAAMILIIALSGIEGSSQGPSGLLQGLSLLAVLNEGGAIIEALGTGIVLAYLARVRPGLVGSARPRIS